MDVGKSGTTPASGLAVVTPDARGSGSGQDISVVIPALNVQDYLGRTIESLLVQRPGPSEVVVVDDGSNDATGEIAVSFGEPVSVLRQSHRGLAAARNAGAMAAGGDVLMFLDADDVLLPHAFRDIQQLSDSWRDPAGIWIPNHIKRLASAGPYVSPPYPSEELAWPRDPARRVLGRQALPGLLTRNWLLANAFVRREVWREIRFDESLGAVEDLDFFTRSLLRGHSIVVSGYPGIVMAVKRPGSLTSQTRLMRAERRKVFKKLAKLPGLNPHERQILRWQVFKTSIGLRLASR